MAKSYRDYGIWQMAHQLAVRVHKMTLEKLPKFEMYEEASQIRRSLKSISSNIVEGFGRRRYKNDFIRFLIYGWLPVMKHAITWDSYLKPTL